MRRSGRRAIKIDCHCQPLMVHHGLPYQLLIWNNGQIVCFTYRIALCCMYFIVQLFDLYGRDFAIKIVYLMVNSVQEMLSILIP